MHTSQKPNIHSEFITIIYLLLIANDRIYRQPVTSLILIVRKITVHLLANVIRFPSVIRYPTSQGRRIELIDVKICLQPVNMTSMMSSQTAPPPLSVTVQILQTVRASSSSKRISRAISKVESSNFELERRRTLTY